jgi:general secretion pathway protein A
MLSHFNLRDNPFRLAPDAAYLFLGRHHEEALAHLRYAISEGEGFTVITGERGAGKSTICRAFVDQLGERVSAAFLAGPVKTPHELMRRINEPFGLLPSASPSLKEMIDALNGFLMQQRLAGRKVAVFIDDAQLLPPEALEQVRLISNLETTRDKLVQIILVGEPDLMRLLDAHALRQMRQRISVCCEIGPLTAAETEAYIQHHMSRASKGPPTRFDPAAVQLIYRHSGGNPRRINIACQAVLAAAFRAGRRSLTAELAAEAISGIEQTADPAEGGRSPRPWPARALAAAAAVALVAGALVLMRPAETPPPIAAVAPAETTPAPLPKTEPAETAPPAVLPEPAPPPAVAPAPVPAGEGRPAAAARTAPAPARMAYSVQVGAYLMPENARAQAERLKARGYPARIFQIADSQGRSWHTVRIGDHPSRQAAQAQADEFNRREQVKTIVRPFGAF